MSRWGEPKQPETLDEAAHREFMQFDLTYQAFSRYMADLDNKWLSGDNDCGIIAFDYDDDWPFMP